MRFIITHYDIDNDIVYLITDLIKKSCQSMYLRLIYSNTENVVISMIGFSTPTILYDLINLYIHTSSYQQEVTRTRNFIAYRDINVRLYYFKPLIKLGTLTRSTKVIASITH